MDKENKWSKKKKDGERQEVTEREKYLCAGCRGKYLKVKERGPFINKCVIVCKIVNRFSMNMEIFLQQIHKFALICDKHAIFQCCTLIVVVAFFVLVCRSQSVLHIIL